MQATHRRCRQSQLDKFDMALFAAGTVVLLFRYPMKAMSTTPNPHISKKYTPKIPIAQGAECGKRSLITFFVFGTLSVIFRSLFLMLLSLFSSLFCQTPFAGLLLRQGELHPTIARIRRKKGFPTHQPFVYVLETS